MYTALKSLALGTAAFWLATTAAAQAQPMPAHTMPPSPGFDQLKPLVGEWTGQTSSGKASRVSYQIVSGGTALMERLQTGEEPEMVSVYSPDGDKLAMTHFCSVGNQPQLRTGAVGA